MNQYIYLFLISMVPLIELRGGMLMATAPGTDYNFFLALIICILSPLFLCFTSSACRKGAMCRRKRPRPSASVRFSRPSAATIS